MATKRLRPADRSEALDAIRRAGIARVVVSNFHSREMCDRAIISVVSTADSDVAIVRPSQVIAVEDEGQLNSLLEQCATDADKRMTIAATAIESKLTRPDASIYDLVVFCVEEAHACDLQPRHATRLALEAVLSQASLHDPNATAATIKATAASIHNCSHLDGQDAITNILELLEREQLGGLALNVLSVLAFSGALQLKHLVAWRKHHMPDPNLAPLFAWVETHATPPFADGDDCSGGTPSIGSKTADGVLTLHADVPEGPTADDVSEGPTADDPARRPSLPWQPAATLGGYSSSSAVEHRAWEPSSVSPMLVAEIGAGRHGVVVLDGLVDDALRAELLGELLGDVPSALPSVTPPSSRWERTTIDGAGGSHWESFGSHWGLPCTHGSSSMIAMPSIRVPPNSLRPPDIAGAGLPRTWGLKPSLLEALERRPPACVVEVQARLAKLFPEFDIGHCPDVAVGAHRAAGSVAGSASYHATSFVANAPVWGDAFQWHMDADPASFPGGSHWLSTYGRYENGTRGKPLLVSLIVYLDQEWWPEWDAETLFCDADTGVGLLVQPQPARCVLMHQDVLHRISTPSLSAHRPRYSLVWKLVFVPRTTSAPGEVGDLGAASLVMERLGNTHRVAQQDVLVASSPTGGLDRETICRPEWGEPVRIGRPARTVKY